MTEMQTMEDRYGVTVCGDYERIVRDRYFFRALCRQGYDLYAGSAVKHLAAEAFALMDDRHKGSYGRAPDDAGRMTVVMHYYERLDLPERVTKPACEIERLRARGILHRCIWSRWVEPPRDSPVSGQDGMVSQTAMPVNAP